MAELTVTHADRVYAACIGIEYLPREPQWSFSGAASDAVRFACWLRAAGVPAANVSLLVSADPAQEQRLRGEAAAADVPWQQADSRDRVMDYFTSVLEKLDGDLLYVYWGGHGVYDHGRWLLFGPDASSADPRCIDLADLYDHLRRASLPGFRQQVFFIDACATYLESLGLPNAPAVARFPVGESRLVERFAWHAVAEGEVAANDPVARTGVFSRALLDWLEQNERGLRPDLGALAACLTERFADAASDASQTPTRHWIRQLDGSTDLIEPADVDEAAQHEVELELYRCGIGADAERTKLYQNYVYRTDVQSALPPRTLPSFARFLLSRSRAMAALVEILAVDDRAAAQSCLALARRLQIPGLLSYNEHARMHQLLVRMPRLSPARLLEVVGQAFQFRVPPWAERIAEFDNSLDRLVFCLEQLERHVGGLSCADNATHLLPPVVRFTEHLAMLVDGELRAGIQAWGEDVSTRLGVDVAAVRERRSDAEHWAERSTGRLPRSRLVVQLYPETDDLATAAKFTCTIWTGTGAEALSRHAQSSLDPLSPDQVVLRIQRAATELAAVEAEPPVVEVVLRQEHIHLPVDAWDGADPADPVPMILSVERPVVLRCAPLANSTRERTRRTGLESRWRHRAKGTVVSLRDAHVIGAAAYGALWKDPTAARAAIHVGMPHREKLIQVALCLGYPVVLWAQDPCTPPLDDQFAPLGLPGDADGLPERVREHRAANCGVPTALRPVLLWDNPDLPLPESPLLTDPTATGEWSERR